MTSPGDERERPLDELSRLYADAGFDETPPSGVDERILAAAARHARRRRRRLRPAHLAWAAAIALSVGLVLEIGIGPVPTRGPAETATDAEPSGARGSGAQPPAADAYEAESAPVSDAADGGRAPATPARIAPRAAFGERALRSAPQTRCGDDARASADTWLACIERLRDAGDDDAARTELDALRRQFPDAVDDIGDGPR